MFENRLSSGEIESIFGSFSRLSLITSNSNQNTKLPCFVGFIPFSLVPLGVMLVTMGVKYDELSMLVSKFPRSLLP